MGEGAVEGMKRITIVGLCLAVTFAMTAVVATAAQAATKKKASVSPLLAKEMAVLTNEGISPARAKQAIHVQGEVAQTDLVPKMEAAMASAYAGVWFESATAQLHIGATSPASRRTAEGVAAEAGLAADVTVTPVRSTWAPLLATQDQWNSKLASLFARAEVETGIEPQRNAVIVTLSSSVPAPERAALEREASAADVNVLVTVVPSAQIGGTEQANTTECNEWARSEAFCNPSITSGATLTEGNFLCTAGPLAIPLANKKQRVLLTAGHCIEEAGQLWEAFNKAGLNSVIGPALEFSNGAPVGTVAEGLKATECGGKCDGGDYADIRIEPRWQTGKANDPVFAVTAEWKPKGPGGAASYPVIGKLPPIAKTLSCHEGQTSGQSCGKIEQVSATVPLGAAGEPPACNEVGRGKSRPRILRNQGTMPNTERPARGRQMATEASVRRTPRTTARPEPEPLRK